MLASSTLETSRAQPEQQNAIGQSRDIRDSYDHYKALGIKLHMLADQGPGDMQEQLMFDAQQEECVKGQLSVLKRLSAHEITTIQEAQLMISVWREEVFQSQNENDLSNADRIALRIFDYLQQQSENG